MCVIYTVYIYIYIYIYGHSQLPFTLRMFGASLRSNAIEASSALPGQWETPVDAVGLEMGTAGGRWELGRAFG